MCSIGLKQWAKIHDFPIPCLDTKHTKWLIQKHLKYARSLIRKLNWMENRNNLEPKHQSKKRKSRSRRKTQKKRRTEGGWSAAWLEGEDTLQCFQVNKQKKKQLPLLMGEELQLAIKLRFVFGPSISLDQMKETYHSEKVMKIMHKNILY